MAPPFTGLGKRLADEGGVWQHSPMPGFTTEMLDTPRGLPVRPKDGTAHCLRLASALAAVGATRPATQDGTVVPPRAPSSYEDVRDRRPRRAPATASAASVTSVFRGPGFAGKGK